MSACTCSPVYGWMGKLAGYAVDAHCPVHGRDVSPTARRVEAWRALNALPEYERAEMIANATRKLSEGRGAIIEAAIEAMGGRQAAMFPRWPVPTLDARTADHVTGFLHWLQIAVQRVHNVKRDPYWCVADAVEAAEGSARYANLHGYDHFVVCNT